MAVIDLGTVRSVPPATDLVRPWSPRRLRMAALAVSAALLLAVGGSDRPAPPELVEVGVAPIGVNAQWLVTDEHLFIGSFDAERRAYLLTAHRLSDGRRAWQVRHDTNVTFHQLQAAGELLLSRTVDRRGRARTTALDARTGQLRWSVPYEVDALPDGRTGLNMTLALAPEGSDRPQPTSGWRVSHIWSHSAPPDDRVTARAVDLTTGGVLWEVPTLLRLDVAATPPGQPAALVAIPYEGPIEVWDARTRAVLHRLPAPSGTASHAAVIDDLLLVRPGATTQVTAYRSTDLRPLWSKDVAEQDSFSDCGPLLCQIGTDRGMRLIDPATGESRWSMPDLIPLVGRGGHLLEVTNGHRPTRTVDPRSGRTLIDLGPWLGDVLYNADGPVPLRWAVGFGTAGGPGTGGGSGRASSNGTGGTAGGTWLAVLEPQSPALRLLGQVPYPIINCKAGPAGHLICQSAPSELRIWRYRST